MNDTRSTASERYGRWAAVLIALITVLVASATCFQARAADRADQLNRTAQEAALRSAGEEIRGRARVLYDLYTIASLRDDLQLLAWRNSSLYDDPVGRAYQIANRSVDALSPLLGPEYSRYDENGFRLATDVGRYEASLFVVEATRLAELRTTASAESSDWSGKSQTYVSMIAMLAIALFLVGLSITIRGVMRFAFLGMGLLISGSALLVIAGTALAPVDTTDDAAIEAFAQAEGHARRAQGLTTGDAAEARANSASQWRLALDSYTRALNIDPDYQNALDARGLAYLQLDPPDPASAIADLKAAVALGKPRFHTWWNLGSAYYQAGRFAEVRAPSQRALDGNAVICGPALNIALAELAQERWTQAADDYAAAIRRCDAIVERLRAAGEAVPGAIWVSMQAAVDDLEALICAANGGDLCRDDLELPLLTAVRDPARLASEGEAQRARVKEALVGLEHLGDADVPPPGTVIDFIEFRSYILVNGDKQFSYPDPFTEGSPDAPIEVAFDYRGIPAGSNVVYKVFLDGVEQLGLRYVEPFPLDVDGSASKRISSWFVMRSGLYRLELYVNSHLVVEATFTITAD